MSLNKQRGNMYGFVTHTWNAIKGKCPHDCKYCYMKIFKLRSMRFDESELKTNLGENNFIFVGSSIDMFADDVPSEWIVKVLKHCCKYPKNKYLFQSKNPRRMILFNGVMPKNTVLGTTIETNRLGFNYNAPKVSERQFWIDESNFDVMITIEPIMDFDLEVLVEWIKGVSPKWVNIGADSKGHNLPEPSPEKIKELINELKKITEVKLKPNLKRLCKELKT